MDVMSDNLFATPELASGYATARPPVHPEVLGRFRMRHQPTALFDRSLDLGCGAGLSTRALAPLTRRAIGLEPAESMLHQARRAGVSASLVAGRGEGLPFSDRSIDFITAAGSLNYTDGLQASFAEARRVLTGRQHGGMLVYDFSQGRNAALEGWFANDFMKRYPKALDNARPLDPEALQREAAGVFRVAWHEYFRIPLQLDLESYVNYMMTETNVADAIRRGTGSVSEIRDGIQDSLRPVFAGRKQEILFDGYMALLQ
jgi:ubiquinone/menaquinone biosynthesis C-methylase UbiE